MDHSCRIRRLRRWSALVLASLGWLFLIFRVQADDSAARLFLDAPVPPMGAAGGKLVQLNPRAISNLVSAISPWSLRFEVNLATNVDGEIVFQQRDWMTPDRMLCRGRVDGRPGSYVILAFSGKAVAGSVFIPGRGMFQIQHAGNGWQRIVEVKGERLPRCGTRTVLGPSFTEPEFEPRESVFQAASLPDEPTNVVMDLLVVYTPAARDGAGGTDGMKALIDAAVGEANLAFENSQVNAQLRLAQGEEVDYLESGDINEDLDRLEDDDPEGPLHHVRELRGLYRADLVCLITETTGGPYGAANQMQEVELEFGEKAFSVVQREFAISYQALAHELGHNLGCQHDRQTSPTGGAFEFSHAYRFEVDGSLYHTVMAYQPGLPIPYYSNPDVSFLGVPTGVAEPATNSANNAKTINLTASTVARFDSLTPTGTPPHLVLVAPTNGATFTVPAALELSAEATDEDGQVVEVEFYVNGMPLGTRRDRPFVMGWTNATPGRFSFRAEARDNAGWEVSSLRAVVTLNYPPPLLDADGSQFLADGTFKVRLRGVDGQAFRLDASEDLLDWLPLTTDSFIGDAFDFIDTLATNFPVRFYRALQIP